MSAKDKQFPSSIVINILNDDTGTVKTMPKKRFQALMNIPYRERLLSLA